MEKKDRAVLGHPKLNHSRRNSFSDVVEEYDAVINGSGKKEQIKAADEDDDDIFRDHRCDSVDSGWETDLDLVRNVKSNAKYDSTGEQAYLKVCKILKIIPSNHVTKSLKNSVLNVRHRSIGSKEVQSITEALIGNTFVKSLDLEGNDIGHAGASQIFRLLLENCFITELSLSENNIGSKGAPIIANIFQHTRSLLNVNLKGNKLKDNDSSLLSEGIAANKSLKSLNLSHNEFRSHAGHKFGNAIATNVTLLQLDLSWNHLRMDGAIAFGKALAKNTSLEILNLRFNGFADNGAEAMGEALAHNDTLKSLDLSHNRISDKGAIALSKGLARNQTLQILNIGFNPISRDGGLSLLNAAKEAKELAELLMEEIYLDEAAFEILEELVRRKSKLKITYQGLIKDSGSNSKKNELAILKKKIFDRIRQYLKDKRLRMIDLFNRWDKDKSMELSRQEFQVGIKAANIPLSNDMIDFLVSQLDMDKDGVVRYDEFVAISGIE